MDVLIRKMEKKDIDKIMEIIELEGEEWKDYWSSENSKKYRESLERSITYVAYDNSNLCGYSRSVDDNALSIIVVDLLVTPKYRGNNIGRELMECIYGQYTDKVVYVMSDVDEYYSKQEYDKVGSIFKVSNNK